MPASSPRYRVVQTHKAKSVYRQLSPRLQQEVTNVLKDIENDGLDAVAEELERELTGRYKVKIDGYRLIFMRADNHILLLDIRRRSRLTYLNLPVL